MSRCWWLLGGLLLISPVRAAEQATRIQGTVIDASDAAVASAAVVLTDPLGAALQTASTDASGRFTFAGIHPGRFTLRAALPGSDLSAAVPLTIEGAFPVEVVIRLPPRVEDQIRVEGRFDAASTRVSLAGTSLADVPVRVRGRFLQDAVATFPGWATEDNGLLHVRGVDDGVLYVIDGVPVYERLDALSGVAPDGESIGSITLVTGYVAPEFGYKAGGVIDVRSSPVARDWRATVDVGAGSNAVLEGGLVAGGSVGNVGTLRLAAASTRSSRFLDPVHPDNLHNDGTQASTSGDLEYSGGAADRIKVAWMGGRARYDVPNTEEQEAAGQDQRQRVWNASLIGLWDRVWSDRTVTQASAYFRRSGVELDGSDFDVPLFAASERQLTRAGALIAATHQRGAHLFKAGIEAQALSLDERFSFFVTDEEAGAEAGLSEGALAHDDDNPFSFADEARPALWAFYVQDTWHPTETITVGAGVRFDRSTLLLGRHQWSPRLGASFRAAPATVVRASASRFFQPPQPEYLLLSSSEQARALSPFADDEAGGGADVEPERQWALEAGIEHRFRRWRVDAAYWHRDGRDMADPNVFFGTTIIFPNAVAKGRAHGVDARIELPQWQGWSGYFSSTIGKVVQTGPITGGLFLEDETGGIEPGTEFVPDHDQRVALAGGLAWEHARSGVTAALSGRYESGTPIQREDHDESDLAERPGAELVNFERGRVKPRLLFSLVVGWPVVDTDPVRLTLRGSILNLFDRDYAYNFGNPFSGTHFGAPRTAAVTARIEFR